MKIKLRKIKEDDLEMIMNWRMDPNITKYMYTDPDITLEEQKKWFKKVSNDDTCLYWVINADGEDIGLINLYEIDNKNQRCGWAYYIANLDYRGKGLAKSLELNLYKFVFETLKLNKLWCEVFSFNNKVVRLHKIYGSEVEGVLKEHIYKNGEFHDIVKMSILKEKWPEITKKYNFNDIKIDYVS
ncbi:hypothetical protein C8C76_1568 [Halanaerobium saccharolyticum]|uniref:N-acetyltransferase domain-containing protein n=1 Tax=Halanaerobium saccharolyticum TaxID=43595 RepID=A0A2T5RFC0_9FIRM|nr:UDP-4-amino-4,6-dideoxy-N-acetyl-beta-L-altrosamine N-acetyltransferase [Halanaerobium saccharolyticum]PTV93027.1 hypothetical protein C8C76_1568 [Halanaerobium saccharolyticum]